MIIVIREENTEKGGYFPIEFAATGSSQIGGNIATNAGGIHVIHYGMMRDCLLVLLLLLLLLLLPPPPPCKAIRKGE